MNIHGHVCKGRSCQYYAPSLFFYCKAKVFINNWGQGGGGERQARRWGRGKGPRGRREPAGGARRPSAGSLGGTPLGKWGPFVQTASPGAPCTASLGRRPRRAARSRGPQHAGIDPRLQGSRVGGPVYIEPGARVTFSDFQWALGGPARFLNNFFKVRRGALARVKRRPRPRGRGAPEFEFLGLSTEPATSSRPPAWVKGRSRVIFRFFLRTQLFFYIFKYFLKR